MAITKKSLVSKNSSKKSSKKSNPKAAAVTAAKMATAFVPTKPITVTGGLNTTYHF